MEYFHIYCVTFLSYVAIFVADLRLNKVYDDVTLYYEYKA